MWCFKLETIFGTIQQRSLRVVPKMDLLWEPNTIVWICGLSENFTDENIIQFKVSGNDGQQLLVKSANLVVRVKCQHKPVKEQRSSLRGRRKRKRKQRTLDLVIYSVNAEGKPDIKLASTKSKLRKTKWLRLSLPKEVVQKAVDSEEKKLQMYVKCIGCDRKTRLILAQKGRKKRHTGLGVRQSRRKLHKRRPILYLHTQIQSKVRSRRDADNSKVSECWRNSTTKCECHKKPMVVDYARDLGWTWLLFPKRFKTAVCFHTCIDSNTTFEKDLSAVEYLKLEDRTLNSNSDVKCKAEFSNRPVTFLYLDYDHVITVAKITNIILTKCDCDT